ncbi:MAG: hypothetical protein ABI613_11405 [Gemmatimonadota bacterium]
MALYRPWREIGVDWQLRLASAGHVRATVPDDTSPTAMDMS